MVIHERCEGPSELCERFERLLHEDCLNLLQDYFSAQINID